MQNTVNNFEKLQSETTDLINQFLESKYPNMKRPFEEEIFESLFDAQWDHEDWLYHIKQDMLNIVQLISNPEIQEGIKKIDLSPTLSTNLVRIIRFCDAISSDFHRAKLDLLFVENSVEKDMGRLENLRRDYYIENEKLRIEKNIRA